MSTLKLDASVFDSSKPNAAANRAKKLLGSHGISAIVQMPIEAQISVRRLLDKLILNESLTEVQPQRVGSSGQFVGVGTNADETLTHNSISPIENLHTTLAAWQVMDAVSPQQWKNEQIRSRLCADFANINRDIFTDRFSRALIFDSVSNTDIPTLDFINKLKIYAQNNISDIQTNIEVQKLIDNALKNVDNQYPKNLQMEYIKPFKLEAESIKLNNDGNLIIQWKSSEALLNFRRELCKHGGIAKWGPNVGTTLAFFPNWDAMEQTKRQSVWNKLNEILNDPVQCLELEIQNLSEIEICPVNLQEIAFSRNNLAIDSANWQQSRPIFDVDSDINSACLTIKNYEDIVQELSSLPQSDSLSTKKITLDARGKLQQIVGRGSNNDAVDDESKSCNL